MKDLRKQVELALTSDLVEEAKLVWVYLLICRPSGAGAESLAKTLGIDAMDALEVLREEGMIHMRSLHNGGVLWKASKFAGSASGGEACDLRSVRTHALSFARIYQRLRKAALGRELSLNADMIKSFEGISDWLQGNSISPIEFMRFGIERSDWLGDQMPFPTPSFLGGPWIRAQWAERAGPSASGRRSPKHAGETYADADDGVRSRLEDAGLEVSGLSEAELRYIETCAATALELGSISGVDSKWIPYVELLVKEEE